MQWAMLLLFLSAAYGTGVSYYLLNKTGRPKFMALLWATVTFFAVTLSNLLDIVTAGEIAEFITSQVSEWGHVYTITLVLGALLLFIRESKPEFSRFPRFYAALPVILIISYLLVYDTPVLKWWILNVAEAGAALVAVILYGMYSYYKSVYKILLAGAILFLITFIIHLFLPDSLKLIWQLSLTISVITIFSGYLLIDKYYDKA